MTENARPSPWPARLVMKCRGIILTALALAFAAGASGVPNASPKPVLVHYMPWYVSKPVSGAWGWHWTMNHFNPDILNPSTQQRQIASQYYPLIGPYDSADPDVLEYHVLLMKLAGIDGIIVDWYGTDNFNDYAVNNTRTLAVLDHARAAGLKFALCYEDSTIRPEINGSFITAAGALAHARQTMLYAESHFFNDRAYLRWHNEPVLLNFGPQYFRSNSDWESIFSALSARNRPAFFSEDNPVKPVGTGTFDWPPMFLSRTNASPSGEKILTGAALDGYLSGFAQKARKCDGFISSAFPRFHDIYAEASVQPSFGRLDDDNGATFRRMLAQAMTNESDFIQVVTWNDFGEGTIVEPTAQFGYRDLGVIQKLRRRYLDPKFQYTYADLELPLRLYHLRKEYGRTNTVLSAEMDRIYHNMIFGNLAAAEKQLAGMESGAVVIYNAAATNGLVRFSIGGRLAGRSLPVKNSPSLSSSRWTTVTNIPLGTNEPVFTAVLPARGPDTFFKVQDNDQ